MYTLDDGKAMKVKVIRLQEQIDVVRCASFSSPFRLIA